MASTIDDLRTKHESLYQTALESGRVLLPGSTEYTEFEGRVNELIEDIKRAAEMAATFEEYRWLLDLTVKWQVVFAVILNCPKTIPIPQPKQILLPPTSTTLTDEEIKCLCERLGMALEPVQHSAETFLASDILDGKLNFASRVAPHVYPLLEKEWLHDIKCFRAYFMWKNRGDRISTEAQCHEDYDNACRYIREMLINPGIKALSSQFSEPKAYLESRYLNKGKLVLQKPATQELINNKAYRIWDRTGRQHGYDKQHRHDAETYIKLFYDHIVDAVEKDDKEDVRMVLKAFQFSKELHFGFYVVNSFEAVLATYFLNADTIKEIWKDSDKMARQESSVYSSEVIPSWPDNFQVPEECKSQFKHLEGRIEFNGVMSDIQQASLSLALEKACVKNDGSLSACQEAIEILCIKSRLVHHEKTL